MTTPVRGHMTAVATASVLLLALTGCASLGEGADDGTQDPGTAGSPVETPQDDDAAGERTLADVPLLQVQHAGGFVPIGFDFATVPQLTVYSDGTAVVHGPVPAIYPPPALPNLMAVDLSDEDVAALLAAAQEAGLLAEAPDYGQPPVADMPATVVTLTVGDKTYEHRAEALDIGTDELAGLEGLAEGSIEAREALIGFIAIATETVGGAGEGEPLPIEAFEVMARPGAGAGAEAPDPLAWPLDLALTDVGDCTVVEGEDAQTLVEALRPASTPAAFEQDDEVLDVWVRVLLPHEEGCVTPQR